MIPTMSLTADDYQAADEILAVLYPERTGLPPRTAERYLRVWYYVVEEVEQGYGGIVAEYRNDLSARESLDNLIRHAPQALKEKLVAEIGLLDARFRAATQPLSQSVFMPLDAADERWWWFRAPLRFAFNPKAAAYNQTDWERNVPELFGGPPHSPADSITPGAVVTIR